MVYMSKYHGVSIWQHHCIKVPQQNFFVRLTSSITCLVCVFLPQCAGQNRQREKSLAQCHWVRAELHIDLCVWERSASVRRRCQWGTRVNYTSSCIVQHSNLKVNVVERLFSSLEISVFWSTYLCMNGELCFVSWTIIKVIMKLRSTIKKKKKNDCSMYSLHIIIHEFTLIYNK